MTGILGVVHILIAASAVSDYTVPASALAVSVITLLYSAFTLHRQTKNDLTAQLYDRIEQLEREIERAERHAEELQKQCAELERQLRAIREENLELMRKLLRSGGDGE